MDKSNIKVEINELSKRKKLINRLLFPSYILLWFIIHSTWIYVDAFIIVISNILKLDNFIILLLNKLHNFIYLYSPLILYIGGKIESNKISKKIERLNFEYQLDLEKNKKANDDSKDWIHEKKEVIKLYDIVERFDKLPRDKQMEVLNYIKGDLSLKDKYTYLNIDKLSNKYKEQLQTECEDILFPDFEDKNNNYTKKREK